MTQDPPLCLIISMSMQTRVIWLKLRTPNKDKRPTPLANAETLSPKLCVYLDTAYPPKAFRRIPSCRLLQTIQEAVLPTCLNHPAGRGQGPINLPQRAGQVAPATKSVTARDPAPAASQACRRKPAGRPGPMRCPDDHPPADSCGFQSLYPKPGSA